MDDPPGAGGGPARLARLGAPGLLDSPPEPGFDRWTGFLRDVLGADVSLITVLDEDRQFFKSSAGLPEPWASRRETGLSHSFCVHVVDRKEAIVVPDARADPAFRDNPPWRSSAWSRTSASPSTSPGGACWERSR